MKKNILLIVFFVTIIASCQKTTTKLNSSIKTSKNIVSNKNVEENKDLDFLKNLGDICVQDDGFFKSCDDLFTKDGFSLFFIIIPKIGAKKWYDEESKNLKGAP